MNASLRDLFMPAFLGKLWLNSYETERGSRPKEQLLEALPRNGERKSCGCGRQRMPGEPRLEVGGGGGPSFSGVLFTLISSKLKCWKSTS